ncbi:MAG: TIGR02117 family protein [Crocinitomicaceae bacterium]|nr:TIGR02117 family protein [Crocinitomicaceae bacterium]
MQLLLTLVTLFVLYMSFAMLGMIIPYPGTEQVNPERHIFIRSNGVHTDICLKTTTPECDWKDFIDPLHYPLNKNYRYIVFGWGDEDFYINTPTWDDITARTAFHALFMGSQAAMHVEYLESTPVEKDNCARVNLSTVNYVRLCNYISETFTQVDGKPVIIPEATYFGRDRFFKAKGSYHLLENCNSWTNAALKTAGIRTAAWVIFPETIISYQKN